MHGGDFKEYSSLDPSSETGPWSILGADLICITADGYIPLLQFLDAGREQRQLAVSDVIAPSVTESVARYSDLTGWQAVNYPEANWLLFNVPHSGLMSVQHVMNVQTGAWCRFTGIERSMLGDSQAEAVFRSPEGEVNEANKGTSDASANISGVVRQAFDYLGSPYDKDLKMIRPHIQAPASGVSFDVGVTVDFDQVLPAFSPDAIVSEGAEYWDEAQRGTWIAGPMTRCN